MLVRRLFRGRAMQFLYAQYISNIDSNVVEHNMIQSIDKIYDLYVSLLNLILALRSKAFQKIEIEKKKKILFKKILFLI